MYIDKKKVQMILTIKDEYLANTPKLVTEKVFPSETFLTKRFIKISKIL